MVKYPTLAQVMISRFLGLSPASGSVLTVQSLLEILAVSLSLSERNKHQKNNNDGTIFEEKVFTEVIKLNGVFGAALTQ